MSEKVMARPLLAVAAHAEKPPPFLLEVRARPLLASPGFPAMLKVMAPQTEGLRVLWSTQAISLNDRS